MITIILFSKQINAIAFSSIKSTFSCLKGVKIELVFLMHWHSYMQYIKSNTKKVSTKYIQLSSIFQTSRHRLTCQPCLRLRGLPPRPAVGAASHQPRAPGWKPSPNTPPTVWARASPPPYPHRPHPGAMRWPGLTASTTAGSTMGVSNLYTQVATIEFWFGIFSFTIRIMLKQTIRKLMSKV